MRNHRQCMRRASVFSATDAITASTRIENMYAVKYALEDIMDAMGYIEDIYYDIEETDPQYILKRYIYDVSRHVQAAYNATCTFLEKDYV